MVDAYRTAGCGTVRQQSHMAAARYVHRGSGRDHASRIAPPRGNESNVEPRHRRHAEITPFYPTTILSDGVNDDD